MSKNHYYQNKDNRSPYKGKPFTREECCSSYKRTNHREYANMNSYEKNTFKFIPKTYQLKQQIPNTDITLE